MVSAILGIIPAGTTHRERDFRLGRRCGVAILTYCSSCSKTVQTQTLSHLHLTMKTCSPWPLDLRTRLVLQCC